MTPTRPVAVVTGGTHGIGRHTVELLADDGWAIGLCSRHLDEAVATAEEVAARTGVPTFGDAVDVGSHADVRRFGAAVAARLGVPSAVVANAGVLGPVGPLHAVDMGEWASTIGVDLVGVANTLSVFAAQMVARADGFGSLITLSGGGIGGGNVAVALSAYTSAKAAVVTLTETVAMELEAHGIRVNAVAPGAIATRFTEPVMSAGPALAGEHLFQQTATQREHPDSLDAFDAVVRFLVDRASPFVSGRLLSARWDDPVALCADPPDRRSARYRLRRIDGTMFDEIRNEG